MAEETQNTQPPLSEHSNLDTQLSTPENIQPFSGNMDLNIPGPGGIGINNKFDIPGPQVRQDLVGNPPDEPGTSSVGDTRQSLAEFISSNTQHISDEAGKDSYGKMFNYDAGPDSNNFYDRYAAYGDDKFTEVGFHPYRDNEANFNANTTMWNDWSRMMRHSFPTLLKRGFIDGPKSLGRMMMGDYDGADLEDAEEYERAAAIGQSSKDGLSAFFNNTVMNFGYTAGIITEAIVEEFALSALTAGSGGLGAGVQAARTGKLIENIGKGLGKFKTGAKAVKTMTSKLSTPTAARTFWQTSRGKKLGSALRVVNPLENTMDALKGIRKATQAEGYLGAMAKLSKTPGAFYRDVRNLNMAISESRLEAGMVENKIFKKLYDDHYEQFGKVATSDEQFDMRQQAKKGSLETFYANAGIIYVTNKITFGNITNPKGGLNNFLRQTRKDIYEVGAKSGEKNFGTLGKVIFDNTKKKFIFEKNNAFNLAKSWWKQPGYATAKKTLGYFKSNVSEGVQENLQETIARANENHYVEAFKKQGPSSALYGKGVNKRTYEVQTGILGGTPMDAYKKELGKEFSAQGFETFMSAFFMGTFAKPLNNSIKFLSVQGARIYDKDLYQKWKSTKEEVTKGIVKNLNEINVDELVNSRLMNLGTQEKVQEILMKGSKKEALDAEVDSFVSTMSLMRRTNTTDVFLMKLKSMQELTDQELADAVDSLDVSKAPKYRERIANSINKLESIEEKFKKAEEIFENPVDMSKISAEELATPEGQALERLHNAWNKSVENFVYLNEAFTNTAERMNSIYDDYLKNTSLATADYGAAKVLFKPQSITRQIGILEQEVAIEEAREDITATQKKKNLKYKRDQIKALREFQNSQAIFYGFYQRGETPTIQLAKKRLAEDGVKEPTEEQITKKLNDLLGDITDEVKQTEVVLDLKEKHDAYIKSLAAENEATVSKASLDDAFTKLEDYYKLNFERRAISEHIDLLTDPGEFLKLVLENEKVFERLSEQRNELNSEIVDEQVNKVELTQLLNKLANLSPPVYMDKQQVLDLLNEKKRPEFLTGFKNEVYNPGSVPYEQGMEFINQYLELRSTKVSNVNPVTGQMMTDEMKAAVEEINSVFDGSLKPLKGGYYRDGTMHGRVSNTMKKVLDDYGYNAIDKLKQAATNAFGVGETFSLTQGNIDSFINTITESVSKGEGVYQGFNSTAINNLRLELESLMKGEILNSYSSEIEKLESALEKETNESNKKLISDEIETLKTNVYTAEQLNSNVLENVLTDIAPKITYEAGRIRGNTLDDMVRDYFDSETNVDDFYERYKDKISEEAFIGIFGATGILTKLKEQVDNGEIYIFSKNLEIGDNNLVDKNGNELPPVAGALDLIIVDKKGKKYIVDLKTAAPTKWSNYIKKSNSGFGYKKFFQNSMQQRAYANLYFNNTNGKEIETLILPIALTEDAETGFIDGFQELPDLVFGDRGNFPNLVEGNMFIKTDNNAQLTVTENVDGKAVEKTVKVKDIDNFIPRKKVQVSEETTETPQTQESLSDLEQRKKDIADELQDIRRKTFIDEDDKAVIKELEGQLASIDKSIKAKKTPEKEESEEDKEFYEDLRQRKRAANANIISVDNPSDPLAFSGPYSQTEYVNNQGRRIIIQEKHLGAENTTIEEDQRKAETKIRTKIEQLSQYDVRNYKRKPLIEDTIDNITDQVFAAEIGRFYENETGANTGAKVPARIKVESVYVDDAGNYVMTAYNLKSKKFYDMTVTPEGDVIAYNREGAIAQEDMEGTEMDDVVFFKNDSFARRKTAEDKANEEKEKTSKSKIEDLEEKLENLKSDLENAQGVDKNLLKTDIKELEEQLERLKRPSTVKIPESLEGVVTPVTINGKRYTIFDNDALDRQATFVKIDGKTYGFYRSSTGTSGKEAGNWYPFYGLSTYVIKDGFKSGTKEWIYNSEASPELQLKLKEAADKLNKEWNAESLPSENIPYLDMTKDQLNEMFGLPIDKNINYRTNTEAKNKLKKYVAENGFKLNEKISTEETETPLELLLKRIDDADNIDTLVDYNALELIKDELSVLDYTNTKELLDRKASTILGLNNVLESGKIYTFKEGIDSKDIKMGDQIRVKTIDGKNKTINATKIVFPYLTLDKLSLTPSEFESKIDFGDKPPLRLGVGKTEVKKTGDVLKDFMNNSKRQSELDKSSEDFLDESGDTETFKNCD